MTRRRRLTCIAGAVLIVTSVSVIGFWWRPLARMVGMAAPALSVDRHIDAGNIDLYDSADVGFSIANTGSQTLVIHEAKTSCHCQGVYIESTPGIKQAVRNLEILPGGSETLRVGFTANGTLGTPDFVLIDLLSNDPVNNKVRVTVEYTPTAKLYFVPGAAAFGIVSTGATATTKLDVFVDKRARDFVPEGVSCEPSNLFTIRFVRRPIGASESVLGNSIAQQIGHLELAFRAPSEPMTVNAPLVLLQDGKEVARIPVTARCLDEFQLTPQTLALPRRSSQGDVYSGTVCCSSRDGEPFALEIKNKPGNIYVEGLRPEPSRVHMFTVGCSRVDRSSTDTDLAIEFVARNAKRSADLCLQIRVAASSHSDVPKVEGDKK